MLSSPRFQVGCAWRLSDGVTKRYAWRFFVLETLQVTSSWRQNLSAWRYLIGVDIFAILGSPQENLCDLFLHKTLL